MHDFEYEAPTTLTEAIHQLSNTEQTAHPLAGGTDLVDHVRTGRVTTDLLVDVKKIAELNVLEITDDRFRLGAAVPCHRINENQELIKNYSALVDSCRIIGGIQIQSRASVGGNLCNSGAAGDSIPALIALDAVCVICGPDGTRDVPVAEFCTGPGQNILQRGELLVELRFPAVPPNSGSHYRRFIPRNEMDIAVVGVAAAVVLNETGDHFVSAKISLGAVAATPFVAEEAGTLLAGAAVNDATIQQAADAARVVATPIDDMRGTAEFRKHLVGVLTERVVKLAVERARSPESCLESCLPVH